MQLGRHIGMIILGLSISLAVNAQSFLEVSTGPGYQSQQYIRLSDDNLTSVKLTDWDLAFTSFGQQDAGVHFNEASGSSMGQSLPEIEVYDAKSFDFAAAVIVDSIRANRLYNDEKSWSYGAFNSTRVASSPFDFGWGKYVPQSNQVVGDKVFVIKLKNGQFKKFMITSLTGTNYNFKYSDLDGSNEVVKTVTKTPSPQKLFYFSFAKNDFVNVAPAGGYDLIYTRYTSIAQDPNSPLQAQYNVTGILSAPAALTAKVVSLSPETELPKDTTSYTKRMDVIGYDWKSFANTWTINDKLVFFIKSPVNQKVYKLRFIDFEGASTGNATIEKTDLGNITSTDENANVALGVFPNPASDNIDIVIEVKDASGQAAVRIIDNNGRIVTRENVTLNKGLNAIKHNVSSYLPGVYSVQIANSNGIATTAKFIKI